MKTAIITAFEPFNNDSINPTESILKKIPDTLYDVKIIKVTLPVVFNHAFERLLPLIDEYNPFVILSLGLAKGRSHINIERVAINVNDTLIADNLGNKKTNSPIVPYGPDGIFTTFPLEKLQARIAKHRLPITLSNSAGTYVCNNLFYNVMHHIKQFNLPIEAGFIHIPATPQMVYASPNIPSMSEKNVLDSLMVVLDTLLNPIDHKKRAQRVEKGQKVY